MRRAQQPGLNRQGRAVSDSMRVASFRRYLGTLPPAPALPETFAYRGFEITGRRQRWFIEGRDPRVFKSRRAAERAVDACIALREEVARG